MDGTNSWAVGPTADPRPDHVPESLSERLVDLDADRRLSQHDELHHVLRKKGWRQFDVRPMAVRICDRERLLSGGATGFQRSDPRCAGARTFAIGHSIHHGFSDVAGPRYTGLLPRP